MAQLELSPDDARRLASVLYSWMGHIDELKSKDLKAEARLTCSASQALALAQKVEALNFNTRACVVCGKEFEATNPRKQTCSGACRQALSRSKRNPQLNHQAGEPQAITGRKRNLERQALIDSVRANRGASGIKSQSNRDPMPPVPSKCVPSIEGTLMGCHAQAVTIPPAPKGPRNRKVWHRLRVTVKLRPDGSHVVTNVSDHAGGLIGYNSEPPVTEAAFHDGFPEFTAAVGRANAGGAVFHDQWVFSFGMHVDGTPWIGDLEVPELAIAKAQERVTEAA